LYKNEIFMVRVIKWWCFNAAIYFYYVLMSQ